MIQDHRYHFSAVAESLPPADGGFATTSFSITRRPPLPGLLPSSDPHPADLCRFATLRTKLLNFFGRPILLIKKIN
ncbi:hypothetical protein M6B38_355325 [Iris pallida]|uniref:Uncharacterized protein n=1 Tax=Iris pallida TaxID=29817 RepID=A0AAX6GPJ0_IRIPA|nr:hypothetical protein M6B38_355325 [Iris pallida]